MHGSLTQGNIYPATWTAIAHRMHTGAAKWWPEENAMPIELAQSLYDQGVILMAQRRLEDRMVLLIKASSKAPHDASV